MLEKPVLDYHNIKNNQDVLNNIIFFKNYYIDYTNSNLYALKLSYPIQSKLPCYKIMGNLAYKKYNFLKTHNLIYNIWGTCVEKKLLKL